MEPTSLPRRRYFQFLNPVLRGRAISSRKRTETHLEQVKKEVNLTSLAHGLISRNGNRPRDRTGVENLPYLAPIAS